jgi:FMN reductase
VLLAATGGTERHSLVLEYALRPLFTYLGAAPVRTGVYAATGDFGGPGTAALAARVSRAAGELATAMGAGDTPTGRAAEGREVTPFEELLGS